MLKRKEQSGMQYSRGKEKFLGRGGVDGVFMGKGEPLAMNGSSVVLNEEKRNKEVKVVGWISRHDDMLNEDRRDEFVYSYDMSPTEGQPLRGYC